MREVVAWCREIFGGNGIVLDHDIARFSADAEAIYSFEGTRESAFVWLRQCNVGGCL